MKRYFLPLATAIALATTTSCMKIKIVDGSITDQRIEIVDQNTTKVVPIDGTFSEISAAQAIEVHYTHQGKPEVKVTTNVKDRNLIRIENKDGVLSIGYANEVGSTRSDVKTTVEVSGYDVHSFQATSASNIYILSLPKHLAEVRLKSSSSGTISSPEASSDRLIIDASSAGEVNLTGWKAQSVGIWASSSGEVRINGLATKLVKADANSAGNITLEGIATQGVMQASSSGDISATQLKVEALKASASSGATINCHARELEKSTSSGGEVYNQQ